jgi:putative transposase
LEETPEVDVLREMISFVAERLIAMEARAQSGAAHGENNPLRLAQRDGYRDWETRAGAVELRILKLRKESQAGSVGCRHRCLRRRQARDSGA